MQSIIAILQVVASASASNTWTLKCTCLSAILFTTTQASSSAAIFNCVSVCAIVLLGPVALDLTPWNSCMSWCWNTLSNSYSWVGACGWILRFNRSISLCWLPSNHMVAACRALIRHTCNCLHFDIVTISTAHTWTWIGQWILRIIGSRNWWDALANSSPSMSFTDFDTFCSWQSPSSLEYHISASSSAVRDGSEWFCWLTRRENSHNAHTTPITISLQTVSSTVSLACNEQSRSCVQFTASVLIMPWISFPSQETLCNELNSQRSAEGLDIMVLMWIHCQISPWQFSLSSIWAASAIRL